MGPLNAKQGQLSDWACSLCQINRTGEARAVSASNVKPSLSFCSNHFRSHVEKHAVLERGLLHTPVPLASYPHRVSRILSHSGIHSDAKEMFLVFFAAASDNATGVLPPGNSSCMLYYKTKPPTCRRPSGSRSLHCLLLALMNTKLFMPSGQSGWRVAAVT